jgi:hypothetical protein
VAEVLNRVQAAFPDRGVPAPASLVVFDGFDQLDKEAAVGAFAGKTRKEVSALVGRGPRGYEGFWGIEELATGSASTWERRSRDVVLRSSMRRSSRPSSSSPGSSTSV